MRVSEKCSCGAEIVGVRGRPLTVVQMLLEWRAFHPCPNGQGHVWAAAINRDTGNIVTKYLKS